MVFGFGLVFIFVLLNMEHPRSAFVNWRRRFDCGRLRLLYYGLCARDILFLWEYYNFCALKSVEEEELIWMLIIFVYRHYLNSFIAMGERPIGSFNLEQPKIYKRQSESQFMIAATEKVPIYISTITSTTKKIIIIKYLIASRKAKRVLELLLLLSGYERFVRAIFLTRVAPITQLILNLANQPQRFGCVSHCGLWALEPCHVAPSEPSHSRNLHFN